MAARSTGVVVLLVMVGVYMSNYDRDGVWAGGQLDGVIVWVRHVSCYMGQWAARVSSHCIGEEDVKI